MQSENLFETAARTKMRFPFKGMVSVEDLWDLPVENLDAVFQHLNAQAKRANEDSLLNEKTQADETLETQIAIIKHIVTVKQAEETARKQAKAKRDQKQKILAAMAEKQDADLQNKSLDELKAMLEGMEE
jgi:microsomal dipeptidase-like Zn-dependent dipeptidase